MAKERTDLSIIILTSLKGSERVTAQLRGVTSETRKGTGILRTYIERQRELEMSFARLFRIVFMYVLAFETLHKVITTVSRSIETMIGHNKQMEDLTLGIATVINMIGEIRVGDRVLQGVEKFNMALKISKNLMEKIRDTSLKAFVPIETVAETFQAIVGFGLQAGATLEEMIDLSTKFAMAVQSLQLPMHQVVQEARDLLQGGIQPASSTLAVILGINDSLIKQWKKQGILIEELKKRLESLEAVMSTKFETLSGKLFALSNTLRRSLGEGGRIFFNTIKVIIDDIINRLFVVEKLTDELGNTFYRITPKRDTINFVERIAKTLSDLVIKTYAFVKAFIIWSRENKELLSTLGNILLLWVKIKIATFVVFNIYAKLYRLYEKTLIVFTFFKNILGKIIPLFTTLRMLLAKWFLIFNLMLPIIADNFLNFVKNIRKNWKNLFTYLARKPFVLLGVFVGLSGAIIGIFNWMIDKLKSIFSDFFEGWLTNKLKSWRDKIAKSGIIGSGQIVSILDMLIGEVSKKSPEDKGILDYIKEGYAKVFSPIDKAITWIEQQAESLISGLKTKFEKFRPKTGLFKLFEDIEKQLKDRLKIFGEEEGEGDLGEVTVSAKKFREETQKLTDQLKMLKYAYIDIPILSEKFEKGEVSIQRQIELWKMYRDEVAKLRASAKTLEELVRIYEELNKANEEILRLQQLYKEKYGTVLEGVKDGLKEVMNEMKSVYNFSKRLVIQIMEATERFIANSIFKALTGGFKTFKDFLISLRDFVMQIISEIIARLIMLKIINPIMGKIFGVGHTGGLVGRDIPKFHTGGLAGDEVPAILQKGEYVVSRKGVEFLDKINEGKLPFGNSINVVNVNINAIDPISFERYVRNNQNVILSILTDNILKNGVVIKSIRKSL